MNSMSTMFIGNRGFSRRQVLLGLGAASGLSFASTAFGQGKCANGYGTPACPKSEAVATAPIKPVFAPTGWKTVALDHITFEASDYGKEAAFYTELMGWTQRSDDGKQASLDIGDWGSAIFKHAPGVKSTSVAGLCFAIEPWNAATVQAALRKRGLSPIAENIDGFESFHVKDPDGLDLQIGNGKGLVRARKSAPPATSSGWKTIWLDHVSYRVSDYKISASFYVNLLGWKETYDEGSQQELQIGEVGDMIIRGGKPTQIDHISFGISPWDTDGVKATLEKRQLPVRVDTLGQGDIHSTVYKSYHTKTPGGFDVQISDVTRATRLTVANAVKPKRR